MVQILWELSIFIIWENHTEKMENTDKNQWQNLFKFDRYDNATDKMV